MLVPLGTDNGLVLDAAAVVFESIIELLLPPKLIETRVLGNRTKNKFPYKSPKRSKQSALPIELLAVWVAELQRRVGQEGFEPSTTPLTMVSL